VGAALVRAFDKIFFSAASTTPSLDRMPTAEPAWLIASMAYSTCAARARQAHARVSVARRQRAQTRRSAADQRARARAWYRRPSGEKIVVRES